jgi:hypothetical protein
MLLEEGGTPPGIGNQQIVAENVTAGRPAISRSDSQVDPPKQRFLVNEARRWRIEPFANFPMPTEVGDEVNRGQAPIRHVVRADANVVFSRDLVRKTLITGSP